MNDESYLKKVNSSWEMHHIPKMCHIPERKGHLDLKNFKLF